MIASLGMLRSVADRVENGSEERRQEDAGTEAYLGLGLCTSTCRVDWLAYFLAFLASPGGTFFATAGVFRT